MLITFPVFSQSFDHLNSQNDELTMAPIGLSSAPQAPRAPVDSFHTPFVPAFQFGDFRFAAADVRANYSFGSNFNQFGIGGGLVSSPFQNNTQFQFNAGFDHYSNTYSDNYSTNGNILNGSATYFWNQSNTRFGPAAGYSWNWWNDSYNGPPIEGYNPNYSGDTHAFSVGGFGQLLPSSPCNFTGSAKAGAVFGDDSGWYAGIDIGYYFCPEFDLCGDYDYSSEGAYKLYALRAEYQLSQKTPVAVSAGINYSAYGNGYTSTQYSFSLKYQWNVPTSVTLEDRAHTGLATGYGYRF